jgi:glycosyltransferase involved in cell wall biosynthesis
MNTAIIVPSRNRPHNIAELQKALTDTESSSELFVIVDHDDETLEQYDQLENNFTEILCFERGRKGMADPLNAGTRMLSELNRFHYFIYMGDDHRPRTKHWDEVWRTNLDELGTGIVYGDDLFQSEGLPTAVGMTADIVKALNGMTPESFAHLYVDDFWLRLGQDLNAIRYLPETVIEHLHPMAGKSEWDAGYQETNSTESYSADLQTFKTFIASDDYQHLLERLRA